MAGGRPTKYNQEILDNSREYLDGGYQECGDVIPSIEGLSLYIKITRTTIYDWKTHEDKEEFSDILDEILAKQMSLCINEGLKGEFNATIAKLVLGKHGLSDKVQQDVTSGGKEIQNNFIINPVKNESN